MRVRNHWSVHDDALFMWRATVPITPERPDDLLNWVKTIIVLGDETGVVQFRRSEGTIWDRSELLGYLAGRLENEAVVDAFDFSQGHLRTRSLLAYYEADGIVETMVDDVGVLLADLRAPIDEDKDYAVASCSPLSVSGYPISFNAEERLLSARTLPSTSVKISFRSDIWLPWVPGRLDPDDVETFYDNRELAHRHSTRLNTFLDEVRRITTEQDGTWTYLNYSQLEWLDLLAGPEGIKLVEVPLPMSMSPYDPRSRRRG